MYSVTDMDTRDRPWAGHHQFIKRDLYRFIKNDLKQLREVKQSFIAYVVPQFYNTDNINICPNETCWSQMHKMILSWRQVFFAMPWEHGRSK